MININIQKHNIFQLLIALLKRINKKRKIQLLILLVLILASSGSEIFSLTLVIPFITILSEPSKLIDYEFVQFVDRFWNIESPSQLIMPLTFIFCFATITSAFLRICTFWLNGKLAATIGSDIGSKAYFRSLNQSYEKYITNNSSEILSALNIHVDNIISFINFVLTILSSSFILLGLIIALFFINTKVAILIGFVMGTFYIFVGYLTEQKLITNSRKITRQHKNNTKIIQEGFGAFRDIILDNSQIFYLDNFKATFYPYRNLRAQNSLLGAFPKYIIEAFGICLLSIIALNLNSSDGEFTQALPIVGVFALGAQKILPAIQNIYASISGIRGGKNSVEIIVSMLEENVTPQFDKNLKGDFKFSKKIVFANVSYKYPQKTNLVLENVNFEIKKGERVGIIGKTGSGKSTVIDLLMGLLTPTEGKILIDGIDLKDKEKRNFKSEWRASIGHVPQSIFLTDRSIAENIAFNQKIEKIDINAVKLAAKQAEIYEFIESMPNKYASVIGERGIQLSGGQCQRIGIARALYKGASVLIFDEATSALDDVTEKKLIDTLNNLSNYITVIMIAHRLTTIQNCDKLIKLSNGKIQAIGKPSEVLKFRN